MAENDSGRLNFGVGLDLSALRSDAEKAKQTLSDIGTQAVRQGSIIDSAMGESGAARGFNTLEAAIRGAGTQIKDMDFGSANEKIGALSYIIQQNEKVLAEETELLAKWRDEAQEAFNAGDTGTLQSITADIDAQIVKIEELSSETENYRNTLQAVLFASDMGSEVVAVPRLYDSEEDIRHVEELREKISETEAELSRLGADGGDTTALTASLSEMKDELNECEMNATAAAAALGSDLGERASEAQAELHALNTAIESQQEIITNLTAALEDARAKYEALQTTEGATSEEVEQAAATYDTLSESLTNAQEKLLALQAQQQTAQINWQNISNEVEQHDSVMVKMLGGYENYQAILGQLPAPLQSVIGGIQGMTGAAKAFIATPVGAVLAAIILALQTLKTWFNSTAEGQMAFAQVSGYVSGVLGQLKEIVIAVGKAIYNAFNDPKKAVSDLWNAIKTNIVNRFRSVGDIASALGKVIKAAFTLDTDGIKSGLKELTDSFLQLSTGVENVTGKVSDWAKSVGSAASESSKIAVESKELEIEVSKWQKRNQELEQQKAKARGLMSNTSLPTDERKAAMKSYEDALNEQTNMEAKFADKRVELQKRSMSLTSNTIEDENKLRDLEADRLAIETKREQEMAMIQRRQGTINNTDTTALNRQQQEEQKRLQTQTTLGEKEAALILSNQEAELNLMKDGHAKKMAELDHERDEQLQKLSELETDFKQLNQKAGTETGDDGLTDQQRTQLSQGRTNVEKTYQKGVKDILEDELSDILTYEQQRLKIQEEYADKRAALYTTDADGNPTDTLREGVTEGNLDELKRSEEEALATVDEEFARREETYELWCNQIANMSLEQLQKVLEQAEKELADLEQSGGGSGNLSTARAKVNTAQNAVSKQQAKVDTGVDKRSIEEWKDLYDVLNDCADSFENIGEAIGGTVGEVLSAAGQIASSTTAMINGIIQLTQGSASAMTGTATAASKAIQTVEKASVILSVVSAALQVATSIANLFNNDASHQKEIEALQTRIDQLQWELDNADVVKLQKTTGDAITKVKEALAETKAELIANKLAVNDLRGAWKTYFSTVSNNTELLTKSAEKLAETYANVAYTANKTLGEEKYSSAYEELENIAQQQLLIQQQIEEEEAKKKTDSDQIAEWEQEIEELGNEAVEIINELVEDIIGGSAEDIAEQLGDAFFEAFEAGEDAAEAWGDAVNDIVSDVIKNMLVSKYLEEPLGEIFDKYKSKWFTNGAYNGTQSVLDSMDEFTSELNSLYSTFADVWESMSDSLSEYFDVADSEREASESGIATASQESVDELNGRATVIQSHTYSINENTKLLLSSVNLILQSVLNIEGYTETMSTSLSQVNSNLKEVKETVNDINTKGLKLK